MVLAFDTFLLEGLKTGESGQEVSDAKPSIHGLMARVAWVLSSPHIIGHDPCIQLR